MIMGFIIHFYITFGTNLLTRGLAHIGVLLPVLVFRRKGISNGVQTEWNHREREFWNEHDPGDLEFMSEKLRGSHEGGGCPPLLGAPPVSWAPRASTDILLPPIYTYVPRKHPGSQRKTISTAVTFCIRKIPSWSLRRRSAGGGIDHVGLLHQHHSPSDELWVVYHRPLDP